MLIPFWPFLFSIFKLWLNQCYQLIRSFHSDEHGTPSHKEPKFIVFYSMLMNLFTMFCFRCKETSPRVKMTTTGTMVTVRQSCEKCGESSFVWNSQPLIYGRHPAGNLCFSLAILMAGATVYKALLLCQHMGLSVISARTYFKHQRKCLFPLILTYWESYQHKFLSQLANVKNIVWSGDGRFDSMGHSAKYGAYIMFNCNLMKILHFEVVQVSLLQWSLMFFEG